MAVSAPQRGQSRSSERGSHTQTYDRAGLYGEEIDHGPGLVEQVIDTYRARLTTPARPHKAIALNLAADIRAGHGQTPPSPTSTQKKSGHPRDAGQPARGRSAVSALQRKSLLWPHHDHYQPLRG